MPTTKRRPKGSGRVRQLPSGRWQAEVRHEGRYVSAGRTFDTKLDAAGWLTQATRASELGTFTPPSRSKQAGPPTLTEYANGWLATRKIKGRALRPRTRDHYRRLLDGHILPLLGEDRIDKISPSTVRAWYAELPEDHPTTRAHAYGLLRTILGTAADEDVIPANPCRIRGAGTVDRHSTTVTATLPELATIIDNMPDKYGAMILLAAWCGLRFGELTELRRSDLDLDAGVVRVRRAVVHVGGRFIVGEPKSKAGVRDVAIPPHLISPLKAHMAAHVDGEPGALLFPAAGGGHLSQSSLASVFYPAREAAGRPDLRFHDLRHTGATLAAATGATLADLMGRLGHSTPAAAMRYQHTAADRDRAIADALSGLAGGDVVPLRPKRRAPVRSTS